MNKVGEYISLLRRKKGFTQVVLGEIIGVSSKAISKWENGDGLPDVTTLPALAQALGTSVDSLLEGGPIPISRLIKSLGAKKDIDNMKIIALNIASLIMAYISLKLLYPFVYTQEMYLNQFDFFEPGPFEGVFDSLTYITIILVTMFISRVIYRLARPKNLVKLNGKNKIDIIFEIIWLIPIVYILISMNNESISHKDSVNLRAIFKFAPIVVMGLITKIKFSKLNKTTSKKKSLNL